MTRQALFVVVSLGVRQDTDSLLRFDVELTMLGIYLEDLGYSSRFAED